MTFSSPAHSKPLSWPMELHGKLQGSLGVGAKTRATLSVHNFSQCGSKANYPHPTVAVTRCALQGDEIQRAVPWLNPAALSFFCASQALSNELSLLQMLKISIGAGNRELQSPGVSSAGFSDCCLQAESHTGWCKLDGSPAIRRSQFGHIEPEKSMLQTPRG